jgi:long-subunit fatty acid transport protein
VYWSDFIRERTGNIQAIAGAVAVELTENIKLGLGLNIFSGETDDTQILKRVAYFDLVDANAFRFSYDTLDTRTTGQSEFSAISFNIGTILDFEHFSIGLKIVSPYTLTRKWEYTTVTSTSTNSTTTNSSGEDKMEVPMSYAIGLSFKPVEKFRIAFDIENTNYSNSNFTLSNQDTTHRDWVDQNILSIGLEYKPKEWLSLLGGYRNQSEIFVPDGAAIKDRGPDVVSYMFGISLKVLYGRFDIAYEIRNLKYYDSYFSNTNYVLETFNNLLFGFTVQL